MIEPRFATSWRRFWAGWIDSLLFLPVVWINSFVFSHSTSVVLRLLAYLVSSSGFLIYQIWMHGRFGQTLGKMACRVVVRDLSERRLSLKQAVLRDILGVVLTPINWMTDIPDILQGLDPMRPEAITFLSLLILNVMMLWWLTELVTMFTNEKRRALHDFIAGSVVVRTSATALQSVVETPIS